MPARSGFDQLTGDAHAATRSAHAAFEQITNAELVRDLRGIDRLALVCERRLRAMTKNARLRDSAVVMSSTIPSLK
jgi:hypothetical protein